MANPVPDYVIERTVPTTYLDRGDNPVNGFLVSVYYPEFDELHQVKVADLKAATVKTAITTLLEQRRALASLS